MFNKTKKQRYKELIITGFETFIIGLILSFKNGFVDDPHQPLVHASYVLDDIHWYLFMIIVGVLMIIIGMLRINKYYLDVVVTSIATGIWLAYFSAFLVQDFVRGPQPILNPSTVFIGFVVVRLLITSYSDTNQEE